MAIATGAARVARAAAPRTGAWIETYNRARKVTSQADQIPELAEEPQVQTPPPQAGAPGVLSAEKYESIGQLKEVLLGLGPKNPEAYARLKRAVNEKDLDSTLEALTKFFQGDPQALCFIYDRLVEAGNADPIDREIVERVMEKLPQSKEEKQAKVAGLFIPKVDASIHSMEKTADRMSEPYLMNGGNDNRFCPKTRNLVSTYLCRFHCLDGLAIDDAQILCGEAIWRQAVMDKFSREYKDKDGKWKGGYLRKRFIVHQDEVGRPYQLKPGHRSAPIHEDAWSIEKRLQEMRRSEGSKRGYSATPGDPKDLYNFDPHKAANTPDSKELAEKKRDPIAKNSSAKAFNLKKALYEGDPSTVENVTTTKVCANCEQSNATTASVCVRCGKNVFIDKTKSETEVASKTSSSPEFMPSINAGIKAANGVYMAVSGDKISFGDTENQASSRLAAGIGEFGEDQTVDEENEALVQMRQETTGEGPVGMDMAPPEEVEQVPDGSAPNTTVEQTPGDGKMPLPEPFDEVTEEGMLGEPGAQAVLDPDNPLDSTAIESQQQAQQDEEQGPEAYQASPDFTPADALDEGELLGLGEDSPAVEP